MHNSVAQLQIASEFTLLPLEERPVIKADVGTRAFCIAAFSRKAFDGLAQKSWEKYVFRRRFQDVIERIYVNGEPEAQ